MGFGGAGGGNASIAGASDAAISNPTNQQVLTYDSNTQKWSNASSGSQGGGNQDALVYVGWSGTAWPSRPSVNHVQWVGGTSATQPPALPGDLWTRAAELES